MAFYDNWITDMCLVSQNSNSYINKIYNYSLKVTICIEGENKIRL